MNFSLSSETQDSRLLGRLAKQALLVAMVLASGCSGCDKKKTSDEEPSMAGSPVMGMCNDGQYAVDGKCEVLTECEPGEYVSREETPDSDRICAPCPTGKYSDIANAESCTAWQTCEPGEFVAKKGTGDGDQECEPCEEGTVSRAKNAPSCGNPDECQPGEEPVEDSDPVTCRVCEAGEYCAGGEAAAEGCAEGTWDHDMSAATECEPWTACAAQTVLVAAGTATSDQECEPCMGEECASCIDDTRRNAKCGLNLRGMVQQRCEDGAWMDLAECADPDACEDGKALEPEACGLNGNEQQTRACENGQIVPTGECAREDSMPADICVMDTTRAVTKEDCGGTPGDQPQTCVQNEEMNRYEWQDSGDCEPHNCGRDAEGALDTRNRENGCGLNSLGLQPQVCEVREGDATGRWVDEGACLTDTVCAANDVRNRPEPCGLNMAGTQPQRCTLVEGASPEEEPYAWTDEGECNDPHLCVIDGETEPFACGLNGNGSQPAECPNGIPLAVGECSDPDECVGKATRVLTTTECTDGSAGDQHQECKSVEGVYVWSDTMCAMRVCKAGDTENLEGGCGKNSRGVQQRVCDTTMDQWVNASGDDVTLTDADDSGCADPDVCTDGEIIAPADVETPSACGLNGKGKLGQVCVGGKWEDNTNNCADPDVCRVGDVFLSTTACTIPNYDGEAYLAIRCADGSTKGELTDDCLGKDRCFPPGAERLAADTCTLEDSSGVGRRVQVCEQEAWINTDRCAAQL